MERRLGSDVADKVEQWLRRAEFALPQYERDEKRASWMFQRMVAFAHVHQEGLATITRRDVLAYLETLARRGEKDWQVIQALDAICILLSHGCGRMNVRISEVRELWLEHRAGLEGFSEPGAQRSDVKNRRTEPSEIRGLTISERLTSRRVGQAALRRAGPPSFLSEIFGGPALEASLSHPTSSQLRQSNYTHVMNRPGLAVRSPLDGIMPPLVTRV